jgi:hypothetical protein
MAFSDLDQSIALATFISRENGSKTGGDSPAMLLENLELTRVRLSAQKLRTS